jgi:hypothetical protein
MRRRSRRQFLAGTGAAFGLAATNTTLSALVESLACSDGASDPRSTMGGSSKSPAAQYNTNLRTAIGLGDEPAGILDKFGQLKTRHAEVELEIGMPLRPVDEAQWSQSLQEGCLPVVETGVETPSGSLRWTAFTSEFAGIKADYIEIKEANAAHRITLWFPFTRSIQVHHNRVTSGKQVLAIFPPPNRVEVSQARYNYLTPQAGFAKTSAHTLPNLDPAFHTGRQGYLNRPIEYSFPVVPGKTYHVFLGLLTPKEVKPGEMLLKLSIGAATQVVDMGLTGTGKPALREFTVRTTNNEMRVKSDCDPSSTGTLRTALLNAIWIFDHAVDSEQVKEGKLNREAVFYVQCGREPLLDRTCSVRLDYGPDPATAGNRSICLPYQLSESAGQSNHLSPQPARAAAQSRWDTLLQRGAEFVTGVRQLDDLYKTSLINIFLLRTQHAGVGEGGQDLYVVKPGATVYDAFWYRDGGYIVTALNVAGHPGEAEKSLRLFWQENLPGIFGAWGQQSSGAWEAPLNEWDGQGQALWALVHHYEVTGDKAWLRKAYGSIRKGARWIKNATAQSEIRNEHGDKPIYFGLLPVGYGEAIGEGYMYYHNFWGVMGIQYAIVAADALQEEEDAKWMRKTYEEFRSNLLASVKLAYERVGNGQFIPASPFDPGLPIWGSMAALFPPRVLDPHDPMISTTLDRMARHSQENEYTFFNRKKMWTYITADWAMCYLLRNDLPMFYKLFDGYVAHASPTNAWVEEIYLDSHLGTGDMPHGWAAAQYVHLHRNCLVFENNDNLDLCWGVQPDWLSDGTRLLVKRAPTRFGRIDFELRRSGGTIAFDYHLAPGMGQAAAREVRLHLPPDLKGVSSFRINGSLHHLVAGGSVIKLR